MSTNTIEAEKTPDTSAPQAKGKRAPAKKPKSAKKAARAKKAGGTKADRNKKAEVIAMLKRAKGATLAEIMAATGCHHHRSERLAATPRVCSIFCATRRRLWRKSAAALPKRRRLHRLRAGRDPKLTPRQRWTVLAKLHRPPASHLDQSKQHRHRRSFRGSRHYLDRRRSQRHGSDHRRHGDLCLQRQDPRATLHHPRFRVAESASNRRLDGHHPAECHLNNRVYGFRYQFGND